jgi:hypothetical protein
MQEHKFLNQQLLLVAAARMDLLLRFLESEVGDRCGHWLLPARPLLVKYRVIWGSNSQYYISRSFLCYKRPAHLVISNIVIRAQPLNLHRAQHPTNIVYDVYIGSACLKKGKKTSGLTRTCIGDKKKYQPSSTATTSSPASSAPAATCLRACHVICTTPLSE